MCEHCEEKNEQEKVLKSFNENSCELKKEKNDENINEEFKQWYGTVAKLSKQLKECILSSKSYDSEMVKLFDELKKMDLKKDKKEIVLTLKRISDYANMQQVNINTVKVTVEILMDKIHGNS